MTVKLLHASPLWLTANAIRMSHDNHELSDSTLSTDGSFVCGDKDKALIDRVGNKLRHGSVLEMAVVWLEIDGISRACLAETSRHRLQSQTVRSTRYSLAKGLKNEEPFLSTGG